MIDNIRQAAVDHFKLNNLHNYRARLSSLSKPNRYGGRYVKLQEFMKNYNRKKLPEIDVTIQPEVDVFEAKIVESKPRELIGSWGGKD